MLEAFTDEELGKVAKIYEDGTRIGVGVIKMLYANKTDNIGQVSELLQGYGEVIPFTFKGDYTDLSYFWSADAMPLSKIGDITDTTLQDSVIEHFIDFQKRGFVKIDGRAYTITKSGRESILEPSFVKNVMKRDLEFNAKISSGINKAVQERTAKNITQAAAKTTGAVLTGGTSMAADVAVKIAEEVIKTGLGLATELRMQN